MKFGELDITIKDYLGRMGPGITIILSVLYKTKIYECAYWYTDEHQVLEMNSIITEKIGDIREYSEYDNILEHLKEVSADYKETADRLPDMFEVPLEMGTQSSS